MFGPRLNTLFKSRWTALLWAGGIMVMAVQFVGFGNSAADDAAVPATPQDAAALKGFLDGN